MFYKSKNIGLLKSKKPIICYKFLFKSEQFKGIINYNSYKKYDFLDLNSFQGFIKNKNAFIQLTNNDKKEFYKSSFFYGNIFFANLKQPKDFPYLCCYLCKCIIPKDSLYFIGNNNELVTNNLIVIGIVKNGRNTPEEIKKRNEKANNNIHSKL